eukprot:9102488-Pyramimonas_sp.AAC.1
MTSARSGTTHCGPLMVSSKCHACYVPLRTSRGVEKVPHVFCPGRQARIAGPPLHAPYGAEKIPRLLR